MKVLIVLAWILGYIVVGVIATVVSYKFFSQDKEDAIAIGVCWPILGTLSLLLYVSGIIAMGICEGGEKLWDWIETKTKNR